MKTRIISTVSLAICLTTPSAALADGGTFSLKGKINGLEGQYLHMAYYDNGVKDDSVKIVGGQFSFSGNINAPMEMRSIIFGNINDRQNMKMCYVYLEPKDMTITIDKDHFDRPVVTGSLSQLQGDSIMQMQRDCHEKMIPLRDEQKNGASQQRSKEIDNAMDSLQQELQTKMVSWIKSHPTSYLAPVRLRIHMGDMDYKEIADIYNSFTDDVKLMPECKEIEATINTLKNIQPGNPAPLFRATNWKGTEEGIADLKGKYVLLDFWATWCVPCRKSFPHIKELYAKYRDKGFDIFCVAYDERNPKGWKAAIEKDGIQDFHHVMRCESPDNVDTDNIGTMYAVPYLPTKFLIDVEGKIIGRFSTEGLDAKLKEIFGF